MPPDCKKHFLKKSSPRLFPSTHWCRSFNQYTWTSCLKINKDYDEYKESQENKDHHWLEAWAELSKAWAPKTSKLLTRSGCGASLKSSCRLLHGRLMFCVWSCYFVRHRLLAHLNTHLLKRLFHDKTMFEFTALLAGHKSTCHFSKSKTYAKVLFARFFTHLLFQSYDQSSKCCWTW